MAYQIVEARRLQWDNLLWQVPILSLTAQAFLFSIALAPDATVFARIFASVISLIVSSLCVMLMARHRQAELTDSHWLAQYEAAWDDADKQHGPAWKARRDLQGTEGGIADVLVRPLPMYRMWIIGLQVIFAAAVVLIVVSLAWPDALRALS